MVIVLVLFLVLAPVILVVVLAVFAPRWRWWLRLVVAMVLPAAVIASDYSFGLLVVGPAAESHFVGEWQSGALRTAPDEVGEQVCSVSRLWMIYPLEICSERQPSGAQYRLAYMPFLFWTVIGAPVYTGAKATLRPDEDGRMCLWSGQAATPICQPI